MIENYNRFCRLAMLDKEELKERRRNGKIYGNFLISHAGACDWLTGTEGVEFVAEIVFTKNQAGKRSIKEVIPVRFSGGSMVYRGKALPAGAVMML